MFALSFFQNFVDWNTTQVEDLFESRESEREERRDREFGSESDAET